MSKRNIAFIILLIVFFFPAISSIAQYSKSDYYKDNFASKGKYEPLQSGDLALYKPGGFLDRKLASLDIGNVVLQFSNGGTLGYDRWGKCWEFPRKSGLSYRWNMAPVVGGIVNGNKSVAGATRNTHRCSDEDFQPLSGYDAGIADTTRNMGFALSDIPESWPSVWPTGEFEPPTGKQGFKGIAWLPDEEGNILADRESYFVVTDNDPEIGNLPNPLNVRLDIWGAQWEDGPHKDYIIFRMKVTNIGNSPIEDMYIGVHDDPDIPEQGTREWVDDFAAFIPSGMDVEGFTNADDELLANTAYVWDGDDQAQGIIESNVPWVGLKILETPEDPASPGTQLGVTTFDVFKFSQAPQSEISEYNQLNGSVHIASPDDPNSIMNPINIEPHNGDYTQSPNSYGPDVTIVIASGPFQLNPGESIPFAFASLHGYNKADILSKAISAQNFWNNSLHYPQPPPLPYLTAEPGNRSVSLYWDDRSEISTYPNGDSGDRLTGTNKFQGYKVYKSVDHGATWGTRIIDFNGQLLGYLPLAQFDLADGLTGTSSLRSDFNLGTDSGLQYELVDNNVLNNIEYQYAITAYDSDDGIYPPLENSIRYDANSSNNDNTISVTPLIVQPNATRDYELFQNYPNPFNPKTRIWFNLTTAAQVELSIFTATGQQIRTLISKTLEQGIHSAIWDGKNISGQKVASGVYIYRLKAGNYTETRKMVLLK